jgi:hypothetical protein
MFIVGWSNTDFCIAYVLYIGICTLCVIYMRVYVQNVRVFLSSLALQPCLVPSLLLRGSLNNLRHMIAPLGRVVSPSQGLYLHRTAQHRETKDKHPCPKRDSKPRFSVRALKFQAWGSAAAGSTKWKPRHTEIYDWRSSRSVSDCFDNQIWNNRH